MKEHAKFLTISALLSSLPNLFGPLLFPAWRPFFLAPFVASTFHRLSRIEALWCAFGCGLLLDLLCAEGKFGLYALTYCIAAALLYAQRSHFFMERIAALPALTALFVSTATLTAFLLRQLFGEGFRISWQWAATDLLIMPLVDASYAFVGVALPLAFLFRPRRDDTPYRMKRPK